MQKQYKRLTRGLLSILPLGAMMMLTLGGAAQNQNKSVKDSTNHMLEEVIISASRADNKTPLTTSTLLREELDQAKIVQSVPFMLNLQPSVEAVGENGMMGNTSMRIRGIDATRINVNINGITLNDPESQGVFWVNIPNLAGMSQSLQIQRGLGASNGGGNNFGGAVNLQTLNARSMPYGEADLSIGSWNTRQYGVMAGTGIGKRGFAFDAAYNGMTTDGYVRGGKGDQQSLFLSGGYYGNRSIVKAVAILGKQMTGICWDGATAEQLDKDPTYNGDGAYYDEKGNVRYYDNETDNYSQQHYQLYWSFFANDHWTLNTALDYTHGDGYDMRYKYNKKWSKYNMTALDTSIKKTDFILKKKMKNDAFTETFSARYNNGPITLTFGEMLLYFTGDHYDDVAWTKDASIVNDSTPFNYNGNDANKKDATVYAKLNYDFSDKSNIYADLQLRYLDYSVHGTDDDYGRIDYDTTLLFFNPKLGWNYLINDNQRIYAVAGLNHREPTRADIKDASNNDKEIGPESMLDIELGYAFNNSRNLFRANAYAMLYKGQLTPTGRITESNYALMENVDKSYRMGIELEAGHRVNRWFELSGNLTLSTNKIKDYKYVYNNDHDNDWAATWDTIDMGTTTLAFSPSVIGAAIATFHPTSNWDIDLTGKYVGKQYCDNTGREEMAQKAYFVLNCSAAYTWHLDNGADFVLQGLLNNVLNNKYRTNAWASYGYDWDNDVKDVFSRAYFQNPGINFTIRAIARF